MSDNEQPRSPWAAPTSTPPGAGQPPPNPPAPPTSSGPPFAPPGGTPGAPGLAPTSQPMAPGQPATPIAAPGTLHAGGPSQAPPSSGGGSKFAVGLIVGLVLGLIVGVIFTGAVALVIASDDEPSSPIQVGGSDFEQNDVVAPEPSTSREEPASVGTTVALGNGWEVTVAGYEPDADDLVADVDFNEPAAAGDQFVLVELQLDYTGGAEESQSPFFGMDLSLVGSENVARSENDTTCTAPDPALDNLADVFEGGSASGNVCFEVAQNEVDSLVLIAEPSMSFDAVPSYFELG